MWDFEAVFSGKGNIFTVIIIFAGSAELLRAFLRNCERRQSASKILFTQALLRYTYVTL